MGASESSNASDSSGSNGERAFWPNEPAQGVLLTGLCICFAREKQLAGTQTRTDPSMVRFFTRVPTSETSQSLSDTASSGELPPHHLKGALISPSTSSSSTPVPSSEANILRRVSTALPAPPSLVTWDDVLGRLGDRQRPLNPLAVVCSNQTRAGRHATRRSSDDAGLGPFLSKPRTESFAEQTRRSSTSSLLSSATSKDDDDDALRRLTTEDWLSDGAEATSYQTALRQRVEEARKKLDTTVHLASEGGSLPHVVHLRIDHSGKCLNWFQSKKDAQAYAADTLDSRKKKVKGYLDLTSIISIETHSHNPGIVELVLKPSEENPSAPRRYWLKFKTVREGEEWKDAFKHLHRVVNL